MPSPYETQVAEELTKLGHTAPACPCTARLGEFAGLHPAITAAAIHNTPKTAVAIASDVAPVAYVAHDVAAVAHEEADIPWLRVTKDPEKFREALLAARARGPIDTPRAVYEMLKERLIVEDQEVFLVVLLDRQSLSRGVAEVARGARSQVQVPLEDIFRVCLEAGASAYIVAHNHPSGKAQPSPADRELTKKLRATSAKAIPGIPYYDHIIVGADEYYSFAMREHKKVRNP